MGHLNGEDKRAEVKVEHACLRSQDESVVA